MFWWYKVIYFQDENKIRALRRQLPDINLKGFELVVYARYKNSLGLIICSLLLFLCCVWQLADVQLQATGSRVMMSPIFANFSYFCSCTYALAKLCPSFFFELA